MAVSRRTDGELELGGVRLASIAEDDAIGTPTYVYDLTAIAAEATALRDAFEAAPHLVAYAVKANSAGPVLEALRGVGCGADVVSGAELGLVLACGFPPDAVLFSGVAKQDGEIDAALTAGGVGIGALQVESVEELTRVAARARAAGTRARISLRVNPAVDLATLGTHAHVATGHDDAKFGIARSDITAALTIVRARKELELVGLSTHAGSQFVETTPYLEAARLLFTLAREVRGETPHLRFVDTGGGFGVDYGEGCAVTPRDFVLQTRALQRRYGVDDLALYVEPGRSLVAAHGVLLARVVQTKATPVGPIAAAARRWLLLDAGMNDLLRPALYQARHRVVDLAAETDSRTALSFCVVGPVCESADDFGFHSFGAEPPRFVALLDAGAYGYTMASRYNGRSLPAEVFVRDGRVVASRTRAAAREWMDDRYGFGLSRSTETRS